MGGQLSIENLTGRKLFATLEQTPYSARYWGHIPPYGKQSKWHQPYVAFDQGYYVLRVFDIDSLPGEFREPRAWSEALKSVTYGVGGVLFPPIVLAELGVWLATGTSIKARNNEDSRWVVPETGQRVESTSPSTKKVCKPGVHIGTNTAFEVTENAEGQLEIIDRTPGANRPATPPTVAVTPEAYLRGFDTIVQSEFTYAGEGKTFPLNGYGFRLHIPPNALQESECKIAVKAALTGQFRFPEGTRLVSGLYWISCPHTRFTEDVTIDIQHCAAITNEDQLSSLQFVVAKCSQGELPYTFVPLKRPAKFSTDSTYGSVTVNEFSIFAIVVQWFWKIPSRYLAKVFYENDSAISWIVHFVIVRDLDPCVNAIRTKYQALKHGPDLEVSFQEDKITLNIPEEDTEAVKKSWNITPIMPPTITKKQADGYTPGRRIPSCQFNVMWNESGPRHLLQRVNLTGVEEPDTFFCICLSSSHLETTGATSLTHHDSDLTDQRCKVMAYLQRISNNQDLLMVGESLGLDGSELRKKLNTDTFLYDMVSDWLDRKHRVDEVGTPTWKGLVQALKHVKHVGIANDIEKDRLETL